MGKLGKLPVAKVFPAKQHLTPGKQSLQYFKDILILIPFLWNQSFACLVQKTGKKKLRYIVVIILSVS